VARAILDLQQHPQAGPRTHRLLAVLLGLLLSSVIAEAVSRITGLDQESLRVSYGDGTPPWGLFDSRLGWVNLPLELGNNRQGFRFPRDYTFRSNSPSRLVLVGDSQVWGTGVSEDEHIGVLLDRELQETEVYPFGVPGYGPVQQMLLLQEIVRDYQVDAVVAVAFVYNDLVNESLSIDYGGFQKPYLDRAEEEWTIQNVPVARPLLRPRSPNERAFFGREPSMRFIVAIEGLKSSSGLYRMLLRRSSQLPWLAQGLDFIGLAEIVSIQASVNERYSVRRIDGQSIPCWHLEACPRDHWLDGLEQVTEAYLEMQQICNQAEIPFAVLLTPSYMEVETGISFVIDQLGDALKSESIPIIDARKPFYMESDFRELMGESRHWTSRGHQVVADVLAEDWRNRNPGTNNRRIPRKDP
jgi:hypothetical protein